jgi:hypothetical protein
MARKVLFSFHYKPDNWRVSQVRNAGVVEGNNAVSDNDWETIVGGGDTEIEKWIEKQMSGRSCAVVLIGNQTAGRKWIEHEIVKAWNGSKGVVGVYIHNLKNSRSEQTTKGANPFDSVTLKQGTVKLSSVVKAYDPPYTTSTYVYDHIKEKLEGWVDEAVKIRSDYK